MAYDFNGAWDSTTGHNAPLYTASRYAGTVYADYNLVSTNKYYIGNNESTIETVLGFVRTRMDFPWCVSFQTGLRSAILWKNKYPVQFQ